MPSFHSPRPLVVLSLLLGLTVPAGAASVRLVAALGQDAPGGGTFAGAGFVGNPAAAGDGWVAFRSLVSGSTNTERIVLARMTAGSEQTIEVAGLGDQVVPTDLGLGRFSGFVGNPGVNADGDVVFVATVSNAPQLPQEPDEPAPAALFVYDRSSGTLRAPVLARDPSPAGSVAFVESFDGSDDTDLDGRSPVITDAGDVVFTAATRTTVPGGAVFRLPAGSTDLEVLAQRGDAAAGSEFVGFGPPAVNATGAVAFRGRLQGAGDGVFRWKDGVLTTIAQSGDMVTTAQPTSNAQELLEFGDAVAIRDDDAVAFLGRPLFDYSFVEPDPEPQFDPNDAATGLLLGSGGAIETLLYPGQTFPDRGRVTDVALQSEFTTVPPGGTFAPNGDVVGYAVLNGGSSEVLARVTGPGAAPSDLLIFGGATPSPSPAGGTFLAATAAPTMDDTGAVVVLSRLAGGPASDALAYDPPGGGTSTTIVAGASAPGGGLLAGPPFVNPAVNNSGDVVFRAAVANGPAGQGLYRWRGEQPEPLVRVGDPAPVAGNPPFTNIVGEHDINDGGTVVFSAVAGDFGRGLYSTGASGMAKVAVVGDPGPAGLGTNVTFVSLLGNPSISADGAIAFRARVQFTDSQNATRRREGIFIRSGTQVRALTLAGNASPETAPFFRFRDLSLRQGVRVAFTASLGVDDDDQEGLFVGDLTSMATVALVGSSLDGALTALSGRPSIDNDGDITILGRVQTDQGEHAAILHGAAGSFGPTVEVGEESPAGGVFRSLGRPAVSPTGNFAFRATFEPNTGGVNGFLLQRDAELLPFVNAGDAAPVSIGGRFSAFNQRAALNDRDSLAFISSLSSGPVENGIFLASPSSFLVSRARVKLGTATKSDTMTLQAGLDPGGLAVGIDPATARLEVSVRDAGSAVWTYTVPAGDLVKKGNKFVFRAPPDVGQIAVRVNKKTKQIKFKLRAQPDFSGGGVFPFEPPARVRIELGDVSGQASVPCKVKGRAYTCK